MIEKYVMNIMYGESHYEEKVYDNREEAEKAREELVRTLEGSPVPIFLKVNDNYIRKSTIQSVSVDRRCFFEPSDGDAIVVPQTTLDSFMKVDNDE